MEKNKGGCPTKLTDDLVSKAEKYLYGGYKDKENDSQVVPTVSGLCCYLGISRTAAYDYAKKNSELGKKFSDTLDAIMLVQETKLVNRGLMGDFNAMITKLMLANHGYRDKQEIDNKSSDGSMSPVRELTDEELMKIAGGNK